MASGTSLQHFFENPLPEKPTLMQALSLNHIRTVRPINDSSFTELFGELHFKESPQPSSCPSSPFLPSTPPSLVNQISVSSTPERIDFDNPLAQSPTLLEPLSFNKITPTRPIDESSITELFGELHFNEGPTPSPASSAPVSTFSSPCLLQKPDHQKDVFDSKQSTPESNYIIRHKSSDSFSSLNSESLQFCTEGLGFESSDDMEELKDGMDEYCWETQSEKVGIKKKNLGSEDSYGECRRSRVRGLEYPPPISCIGRAGKPWVWFKSYRDNGRFVLKEIRIPTREFLYAYREDGRLKLHFVLPEDEFLEEQNEEEEEEEEEEEDDEDAESRDEEEKDDGVVSIDEEEENTEKENFDCIRDQGKEGKEIDV